MLLNPNIPYVPAKYGGGQADPASWTLLINHSIEADPVRGLARELASGWLQNEQVSIQAITDPAEAIQTWPSDAQAWGCGNGNQHGDQFEHTGRAADSVEQWNSPAQDEMLRRSAKNQAWHWVNVIRAYHADAPVHPEWLSLTQIANGECGLATHNDCRQVFGGTTHTDPGPNFPYAKLRDLIAAEIDALTGGGAGSGVNSGTGAEPGTPPTPPIQGDDDMPFDKAGFITACADPAFRTALAEAFLQGDLHGDTVENRLTRIDQKIAEIHEWEFNETHPQPAKKG